jgi:hypothetical protein
MIVFHDTFCTLKFFGTQRYRLVPYPLPFLYFFNYCERFETLTAVTIEITVVWDVTPCRLVDI